MSTTNERSDRADELLLQLYPLLRGEDPAVQGLVIADLMAKWLGGHRADIRAQIMEPWFDTIRKMAKVVAERGWGETS